MPSLMAQQSLLATAYDCETAAYNNQTGSIVKASKDLMTLLLESGVW